HIVSALNVKKEKIESKGIKSIRSRVTNISEYLDEPITMDAFKEIILKYIFDVKNVATYQLLNSHRQIGIIFTKFPRTVIRNGNGTMANHLRITNKRPISFLRDYSMYD